MSASAWEQRRYEEPAPVEVPDRMRLRTGGERDRDRILYCTAFQRLAGITQVVPAGAGQAVHSRLTHSMKVAQVARRLTQRILADDPELAPELDPDGVEASALAHDLGHPPFGHIAERELNAFALAHDCDGFEGNAQSFRIVTRLAQRWPPADEGEEWGLNLTRGTLDALLKYPWRRDRTDPKKTKKWGAYDDDAKAFEFVRRGRAPDKPSLGASVMDWCDDLTYAVHDMEDFFRAGLVPLDRLCTSAAERERFADSFTASGNLKERLHEFSLGELESAVERLFELLDFVEPYTGERLQRQGLRERTSLLIREYIRAFELGPDGVHVSAERRAEVAVLKELIWFYVIDRPELASVQAGQRQVIAGLCASHWKAAKKGDFRLFPPLERGALEAAPTPQARVRVVVDYVARLTEGRALELHQRLMGVSVPALPPSAH
jgi:dGTPase